jgi:hypothetical protein
MKYKSRANEKLKNIKAIKEMLAGEHSTQTKHSVWMGENSEKPLDYAYRGVGETWKELDKDGNVVWVITKIGPSSYLRRSESSYEEELLSPEERRKLDNQRLGFPNCPKEHCMCTSPSSADMKLGRRTGMCLDCTVEKETELKIKGQFNEYALDKMRKNAESFIRDAESELDVIKRSLQGGITYIDENGKQEVWSGQNIEAAIEKIDKDWAEMKTKIAEKYQGGSSS